MPPGKPTRRVFAFSGGAVHFDLPPDWEDIGDDHALSFSSPAHDATFTLSVHDTPQLSPEEVDRLLADAAPFGAPRSPRRPLPLAPATGYAQEFEQRATGRTRHWLVHFLFYKHATVIASLSGPAATLRDHRPALEPLLASIAVLDS